MHPAEALSQVTTTPCKVGTDQDNPIVSNRNKVASEFKDQRYVRWSQSPVVPQIPEIESPSP